MQSHLDNQGAQDARKLGSSYIPGLDGLRAIAVLAVLLYHIAPNQFVGGYVGVDFFFVISGFLITYGILRKVGRPDARFSLKDFWLRRVRRLFPALVVLVLVCVPLAALIYPELLVGAARQVLGALTCTTNWVEIVHGSNYFDQANPMLFKNLWSVAVEEQFYLIWPPILLALLARRRPLSHARMLGVAGGIAVVSLLLMGLLASPENYTRVYYGTDTHCFGLALGILLALVWDQEDGPLSRAWLSSRRWVGLLAPVGLAGFVALVCLVPDSSAFTYPFGLLLASLCSLCLVTSVVARPARTFCRVMELAPMRWVGTRSYGIYLWHYPLLLLMNPVSDISAKPWWMYVIQILVIVGVAELSYRFIETPFRHGAFGRFVEQLRSGNISLPVMVRRHVPLVAVCSALAVVALGGLVFVPNTSALSEEGAALLADGAAGNGNTGAEGGDAAANATGEGNAMSGTNASGDADATDDSGFPAGSYDILMVGDSVSLRCVDTFANTFPHGHIDAAKSRQFSAGIETYRSYVDQNLAGKIAVFALGTNGLVTDEQIDELMGLVGSRRVAVFINTRSPQPWVGATNEAIARAAERYDNVHVIDWYGYSANRNDVFDGDGTHLNNKGANEYINLVYDAVKEDLPVHPEDHASDPQPAKVHDALNKVASALAHGFAPHALNPKEGSAA